MLNRVHLAALVALVAGCYGPPSPESCYARYGDNPEKHRLCMAHYRRRNGMATEQDWYLIESRLAKHGRRGPAVAISMTQQQAAPTAVAVAAAPPAPFAPGSCKRWECAAVNGATSCTCLEAPAPQQ